MSGVGGPTTFRLRLGEELRRHGVSVSHELDAGHADAVLVITGLRDVVGLARAKRAGTRLVQRLDGLNWRHDLERTGQRNRWQARARNRLAVFIRDRLADAVVYQSHFVRHWWHRQWGAAPAEEFVIHNGVDVSRVDGDPHREREAKMVCVEGNFHEDPATMGILQGSHQVCRAAGLIGETVLFGRPTAAHQRLAAREPGLVVAGEVCRRRILEELGQAALYLSLDINAACPNSVIEALATATPVIGFDSGALRELVPPEAGAIVDYEGDPWRLDPPRNVEAVADAARPIVERSVDFRVGARRTAEACFDLREVADRYLAVLLGA